MGAELPRGNLLLSIRTGPDAARGVTRLARPSLPPPPAVEIVSIGVEALAPKPSGRRRILVLVGVAAVLIVLAWWFKR